MPAQGKKYYRIGEVSRITGVEPHVLRYWESEFPQIKPRRVAKQRLFRQKDLELVKRIHHLVHNEGFTINGAKKRLARDLKNKQPVNGNTDPPLKKERSEVLARLKQELAEIEQLLEKF